MTTKITFEEFVATHGVVTCASLGSSVLWQPCLVVANHGLQQTLQRWSLSSRVRPFITLNPQIRGKPCLVVANHGVVTCASLGSSNLWRAQKWDHLKRKSTQGPVIRNYWRSRTWGGGQIWQPCLVVANHGVVTCASLGSSNLWRAQKWDHLKRKSTQGPVIRNYWRSRTWGGADTFKKTLICLEGNDPSSGEHYSIPLRSSQQRPNLPVFASPTWKQRTRRVSDPWRAFWADSAPFKGPRLASCVASGTPEIQGQFSRMSIFFKLKLF